MGIWIWICVHFLDVSNGIIENIAGSPQTKQINLEIGKHFKGVIKYGANYIINFYICQRRVQIKNGHGCR